MLLWCVGRKAFGHTWSSAGSFASQRVSVHGARRAFTSTTSVSDTWDPWDGKREHWIKNKGNGMHGFPDFLEHWNEKTFYQFGAGVGLVSLASFGLGNYELGLAGVGFTSLYLWRGRQDMQQTSHTIRRNFPFLGNIRYIFETLRPELYQYFVEGDDEGKPFDRMNRSTAYSRAKSMTDTMPFGTRKDVYAEGYEFITHSLFPVKAKEEEARVLIGGPDCSKPYSASILNISAMSYGSLSDNAILALNSAAKTGGFYHNTGEGGISPFHEKPGGDIVWNLGTGYFGARSEDGSFCPEMFKEKAMRDQVKMIEIKLSQGAKPAHGGILPKEKITPLISEIRGIPMDRDCDSPPRHSAFEDEDGLIRFVAELRKLSGGKPVGFKLCIGKPEEFAAIVAAMIRQGVTPDFITVDGAEGGTGAAPPEFSNHIGMPLFEAISIVNNMLTGAGLRGRIKIIASGKVLTGFNLVKSRYFLLHLYPVPPSIASSLTQARTPHARTRKHVNVQQSPWEQMYATLRAR